MKFDVSFKHIQWVIEKDFINLYNGCKLYNFEFKLLILSKTGANSCINLSCHSYLITSVAMAIVNYSWSLQFPKLWVEASVDIA
jgi:hypothetical protein